MKKLKGKFVLMKDPSYQGIVEAVEGDWVLIQTFSWVLGHDYDLRLFNLKDLTGRNCAFFKTEEEFKEHAGRQSAKEET